MRAQQFECSYKGGFPQHPQSLTRYLYQHMEWMQIHNFAYNTMVRREYHLGVFIDWCTDRGLITAQEITRPILERYQRLLFYHRKTSGEPLSWLTQKGILTSIRMFFRWLCQYNHILYNPGSELILPQEGKKLPKVIASQKEIENILAQPDTSKFIGIRDKAILETLYSTGIRRAELINIKLCHLDLEQGTLFVREGKGDKDRVVPIGERACKWIIRYLNEVRPEFVTNPDEHYLFLGRFGKPFQPQGLSCIVRGHIKRAKIGKKGCCHLFRHSMATHMLDNGADVRYIQAILGHAELTTTQIYTHVSIQQLREVHKATHPAKLPGMRHGSEVGTQT